jgi:hypothetical protein
LDLSKGLNGALSNYEKLALFPPNLGEANPRGLEACPQENSTVGDFLLFQKRSKSVSSASQKAMGSPNLGEADPGGLGACPQNKPCTYTKQNQKRLIFYKDGVSRIKCGVIRVVRVEDENFMHIRDFEITIYRIKLDKKWRMYR